MEKPKMHRLEQERLEELNSYNILDTLPEEEYDILTRLAASICDAPISLVSLVDKDRQWFKSAHGVDFTETPRDYSFCAHAIHQEHDIFEVEDSRKDERFADNPVVTGDANVVFYAGVPILGDNDLPLGSFCVIDQQPRTLTASQKNALRELSEHIAILLKNRRREQQLKQQLELTSTAQEEAIKQLMEQQHMLNSISTPVTKLWDGILFLPLVGIIDSKRAQNLMEAILENISSTQSKVFILDISGIAVVDTAVANHLIKITKAAKLMGCLCIVSGISGAVAQTIVELGIQVDEITTTGTMKDALNQALKLTGANVEYKD